jgi:UDP-glucose 4-epimerase
MHKGLRTRGCTNQQDDQVVNSQTHIVLVGAGGIVGTSLLEEFLRHSWKLTVVSRSKLVGQFRYIEHDARGEERIDSKIQDNFDILVINAGHIKGSSSLYSDQEAFVKVNIDFTLELLELAKKRKASKVIFTSGLLFLGDHGETPVTENDQLQASSVYAASKLIAESVVASFCRENGISYYCFRLSSPVNISDYSLHTNVVGIWMREAKEGRPITVFGKGDRQQNFVSTSTVAQAYVAAIKNEANTSGIYNLASTGVLTMNELAGMIAERFGVPVNRQPDERELPTISRISTQKIQETFGLKLSDSRTVIRTMLQAHK